MIITQTPLRISIGGGGTDLPWYYERQGGFVISAAIDKYIYIALNRTFRPDYFIKYSELERVNTAGEIKHPIIREAVTMLGIEPAIELVSMADIPAGTGLGSSGAFTVGLLRTLHAFRREPVTPYGLAEAACDIEINRLNGSGGKQDQYIAAFGGITCFTFNKDGRTEVNPLAIPLATLHDLESHLLLFFTGYSRSANAVLSEHKKKLVEDDAAMIANLDQVKELGYRIRTALETGNPAEFGRIMDEHWQIKLKRGGGISNPRINELYQIGRDHGAIGGKLVGAGGGGFLMFYAEDPGRLRAAMTEQGLEEVRFQFDYDGSRVTVRDH